MISKTVSILGVCGSLRPGSFTLKALERVLEAAQGPDVETGIVHGEALQLPWCDGRPPDEAAPEVLSLLSRVRAADVLVLATPDYCGTFSAVLKNVLDWLAPDGLGGKVVGLVSVAGGPSADGSLTALREVCLRQAAWVIPIPAAVPLSNEVFGKPEAPFSRMMLDQLGELGRGIPQAARLLAGWRAVVPEVRYQV